MERRLFLILLAFASLMMVGCKVENGSVYTTTTIDSCEYIIQGSLLNKAGVTHKGNCRFCKERRQKELEELVIKLKEK